MHLCSADNHGQLTKNNIAHAAYAIANVGHAFYALSSLLLFFFSSLLSWC
jgi:hypothetical protein